MARTSTAEAAANRRRILDAAARLFRERGLAGAGVADATRAAGLTHGGFYRHFESKEALAAEAAVEALRGTAAFWDEAVAAGPGRGAGGGLDEVLGAYLSAGHRDERASGCVVAALGCELARLPEDRRAPVADAVRATIGALASRFPDADERARVERATFAFSAMVGALVLSRLAVERGEAEAILRIAAERLGEEGAAG